LFSIESKTFYCFYILSVLNGGLGGQVGREFAPSAEGRGSNFPSGQVKDWKFGACCFPSKRSPFDA